jgi:CPA1 family monovalent cation:H+ antiporter
MREVGIIVALVVGVVVISALARLVRLPSPVLLVAGGIVVSFLPGVPEIHLEPELVLVVLLPPLLYAAAVRTSLIDVRRNVRWIVLLAVGLVLFTAAAVGVTMLLAVSGLSLATAMAFGAVIAPTDAVAATAVAHRIGLERKLVTVLEGESMFNDATALVLLQVALLAVEGAFHPVEAVGRFVLVAAGGIAVGAVVAGAFTLLRRNAKDTLSVSAMSLVAPYAAFIPAEELKVSGVLAVVVTGLILAHRSPIDQSPQGRLVITSIWGTVQFVLEGVVFALIGLQLRQLIDERHSTWAEIAAASVISFAVVVLTRPIWIAVSNAAGRLTARGRAASLTPKQITVVSWAGMRGVVSLAAALSLPLDTDRRDLLLISTIAVIVGTLCVQGLTLPWVIRKVDLEPPDPRLDALQQARAQQLATTEAIARLRELAAEEHPPPEVVDRLERFAELRAFIAWENLAPDASATPTAQFRRLRNEMIAAERGVLVRLRDGGELDDEVLRRVQLQLDLEEAMLTVPDEDVSGEGGMVAELIPNSPASCEHLDAAASPPRPTDLRCDECVKLGWEWVHLRQCLECGQVGCCDSSRGRHATAHFHSTLHPVMRSAEEGEAWRWCYVDRLTG